MSDIILEPGDIYYSSYIEKHLVLVEIMFQNIWKVLILDKDQYFDFYGVAELRSETFNKVS